MHKTFLLIICPPEHQASTDRREYSREADDRNYDSSYCRKRFVSKHADTRPRRQSSSSNPATFCLAITKRLTRYTNRCGLPTTRFQLVRRIFLRFQRLRTLCHLRIPAQTVYEPVHPPLQALFSVPSFRHLLEILRIGRSSHPFQNPPLSGMGSSRSYHQVVSFHARLPLSVFPEDNPFCRASVRIFLILLPSAVPFFLTNP